jgi:single-strand DNA-binding protein
MNTVTADSTARKHRNEVHLAGVLAQDPTIRHTQTGKAVASVNVATTYEKRTEYHRVTCWEQLASKVERFKKGSYIQVVGRLQTRSYEKDGQKHWITEVVAWTISDGTTEKNAHGLEVGDDDIPF